MLHCDHSIQLTLSLESIGSVTFVAVCQRGQKKRTNQTVRWEFLGQFQQLHSTGTSTSFMSQLPVVSFDSQDGCHIGLFCYLHSLPPHACLGLSPYWVLRVQDCKPGNKTHRSIYRGIAYSSREASFSQYSLCVYVYVQGLVGKMQFSLEPWGLLYNIYRVSYGWERDYSTYMDAFWALLGSTLSPRAIVNQSIIQIAPV